MNKFSKWINVEDALPESDTRVLVCLAGRVIEASYFFEDSLGKWFSSAGDVWDGHFGGAKAGYVTHWMPQPKLPKKLKEVKDETHMAR